MPKTVILSFARTGRAAICSGGGQGDAMLIQVNGG